MGNIGSVSTAFQTGSQAFISWSKFTLSPSLSLRSNIRGAKPKQLVCRLDMRSVSMSLSPAEIKAKSTRTLSSWVAVRRKIRNDVYNFLRLTLKWVIILVCVIQAKSNFSCVAEHINFCWILGKLTKAGETTWDNGNGGFRLVFPYQTLYVHLLPHVSTYIW